MTETFVIGFFICIFCLIAPAIIFLCTRFTSDNIQYASDANAATIAAQQQQQQQQANQQNNTTNNTNAPQNSNFSSDPRTTASTRSGVGGGAGGSIDARIRPTEKVKVIQDNLRPTDPGYNTVVPANAPIRAPGNNNTASATSTTTTSTATDNNRPVGSGYIATNSQGKRDF